MRKNESYIWIQEIVLHKNQQKWCQGSKKKFFFFADYCNWSLSTGSKVTVWLNTTKWAKIWRWGLARSVEGALGGSSLVSLWLSRWRKKNVCEKNQDEVGFSGFGHFVVYRNGHFQRKNVLNDQWPGGLPLVTVSFVCKEMKGERVVLFRKAGIQLPRRYLLTNFLFILSSKYTKTQHSYPNFSLELKMWAYPVKRMMATRAVPAKQIRLAEVGGVFGLPHLKQWTF